MKVLQIINGLGTGGAEKLVVDTAPLYLKHKIQIDILLLNGTNTPFLRSLLKEFSGNVFSLGNFFYNPFYIFKLIPYLKNYDIIHVHLFPSLYFAAFAKTISRSNTKFIFTEHSTSNTRLNISFLKYFEKWIYSNYDKIIAITKQVSSVLQKKIGINEENISVIENGINLNAILLAEAASRSKMNYTIQEKIIIMVGGFRVEKDQDTLIKALQTLPVNYKLILVGSGNRESVLKSIVLNLGLINRVEFLGVRQDVINLIKMSDIAVLSSHWEGFGLAAVEAMACGVPLIASNVDGLAQVVENGGLLFEKGNHIDLRDKILSLENESFYNNLKKQGLAKSKNYDINVMINKTIQLYVGLCTK